MDNLKKKIETLFRVDILFLSLFNHKDDKDNTNLTRLLGAVP